MGSPVLVTISAGIFWLSRTCCARVRAAMIKSDFPEDSLMPSKVTFASHATANSPARRTARSACSEPSVQASIFTAMSPSLRAVVVACQQSIKHNAYSNQGQGNEGQANPGPDKELSERGADLSADGGAGVHDQRNQNVYVALQRVRDRT